MKILIIVFYFFYLVHHVNCVVRQNFIINIRKYTLFWRLRWKEICKVGIGLPIKEIVRSLIFLNINTDLIHQQKAWCFVLLFFFFFNNFHFNLKPSMIWCITLLSWSTPFVNNLWLLNRMYLLGNVRESFCSGARHTI